MVAHLNYTDTMQTLRKFCKYLSWILLFFNESCYTYLKLILLIVLFYVTVEDIVFLCALVEMHVTREKNHRLRICKWWWLAGFVLSWYQTSDINRTILSSDNIVRFLSLVWRWKLYNFYRMTTVVQNRTRPIFLVRYRQNAVMSLVGRSLFLNKIEQSSVDTDIYIIMLINVFESSPCLWINSYMYCCAMTYRMIFIACLTSAIRWH